jgi:nucleoside-diphosphate-sugar epimerase
MITLVTGANGFVGSRLCARLREEGLSVRCAVRRLISMPDEPDAVVIGGLLSKTDWSVALRNVSQIVHLAACVHVTNVNSARRLAEFRSVNVDGTARLASQAAAAGVRRFVFVSSIKVNGEFTEAGKPFTADDVPSPEGAYAISKYEAERLLRQISSETGMEVVIIRPPLVYGPGVKANFGLMMRWLARGVPLPLAGLNDNCRSFVALENLVDLILVCLAHPSAANQTFLVSDGEDLSTVQLLKRLGVAMERPARLFYFPTLGLLRPAMALLGKRGVYKRLHGSLQIDLTKTRRLLDWTPPVSVEEGFRRATEGFYS